MRVERSRMRKSTVEMTSTDYGRAAGHTYDVNLFLKLNFNTVACT